MGSPFYVDEIVIITWYIKAKIYEYGNGMSRKEKITANECLEPQKGRNV
ncbi:hypothetical protein HMPREF9443_00202 [Phascolarctobacterium succinatutens YIT 12067]|uniref:Uncharacterized protein n=1 Tax=Phascolarctobacterium succinatutens YIT 12067 TaxID=626939 RepID=E8LBJ1_9FIRM|nr:hypothetical protein HMPREF9443_00202 [Phascolarctobacterium succinatutens YIT 12067]